MIARTATTHIGIGATSIEVRPIQLELWREALARGQGLAVEPGRSFVVDNAIHRHYLVQSERDPDRWYSVIAAWDKTQLRALVACECEAGHYLDPCKHAARALDDARFWPIGMISRVRTTGPACPYCGGRDLGAVQRLRMPHGYQWETKCYECAASWPEGRPRLGEAAMS